MFDDDDYDLIDEYMEYKFVMDDDEEDEKIDDKPPKKSKGFLINFFICKT